MKQIEYICDDSRHLWCLPYSAENLHQMAKDLNIKRCWYHKRLILTHYDIPKRRIKEIEGKCTKITSTQIFTDPRFKPFFSEV